MQIYRNVFMFNKYAQLLGSRFYSLKRVNRFSTLSKKNIGCALKIK